MASALVCGVAGAATTRVSVTDAEGEAFGSFSALSGTGRYAAFSSTSDALAATSFNEIFVRDVLAGSTTWASDHPPHAQVNITAYLFALSQNGRLIAFGHPAPTLDANTVTDVFLKNLDTSVLTRVSVAAPGQPENGDSLMPAISSDGRYVAFISLANLLAADVNATRDVYLRDMQTGTLLLMSVAHDGQQANAGCSNVQPRVSDDGCLVAFSCGASNLVAGDGNGSNDVFVRNRCAGLIERVSVASDETERNEASGTFGAPSMSADGRYVAFYSAASFDPADPGGIDIYVRDRLLGETQRVSIAMGGGSATTQFTTAMSRDGRFVAYASVAANIVPNDMNNSTDIFVYDRMTGTTTRRSVASDGLERVGHSAHPSISDDGMFVAFQSMAPLVPEDSNGTDDVYLNELDATCGNGVIEPGETCDDGNTANGDCCSAGCQYESSATVCRSAAGACDVAEHCTGSSSSCPANVLLPSAVTCRPSAGVCDVAESCTGASASCPADGFASSATVCRSAAGACDAAETCTGSAAACPADIKLSSGTVCRSAAGVCDVAETCNGSGTTCPSNGFASSATVCRSAAGVCDVGETCTGSAAACPADAKLSSGTVCRSAVGVCDVAETCNGSSATCPSDGFASSATVCRSAAGVCDVTETCTGSAAACPADIKLASGTVCRSAAGVCDVAEICSGSGATCPSDGFASSATVCRSAAGVCDVTETCTGSAAACPADIKLSSGTVCRSAAGVCDVAETCNGSSTTCPSDGFASSATVCRSAAGICDVGETCTGSAAACPADAKVASGTVCRAGAGVCDVAEVCNGATAGCPSDLFQPASTPCRPAAGECDLPETCTGSTASCPADVVKPNGTGCADDGNACTLDRCDGATEVCRHTSDPACACGNGIVQPANDEECDAGLDNGTAGSCCTGTCTFRAAGAVCRTSDGACDTEEACTGSTDACPADVFEPSTTVCRSAAGACDTPESCTGTEAACPDDAFEPGATVCRPAAGECDLAEICSGDAAACPADVVRAAGGGCTDDGNACTLDECDGSSVACGHTPDPACACGNGIVQPANQEQCDAGAANGAATSCCTDTCTFRAPGAVCRTSDGPCDVIETCTGSAQTCPADAFEPSTTVCRAVAGECDIAEHCSGSTAACPVDAIAASGAGCADDNNACTLDQCDGTSVTCQHSADPTCACGNGILEPDHDEQCDTGVANGAAGSCCTLECTWRAAETACRPSASPCDVPERCSGADATCPADTQQPDGTTCDDLLFCNGADSCADGQCSGHAGSPCPGPDGDADCAESCGEATKTCTAADPEGAACDDGDRCTPIDRCSAGVCSAGEPVPCPEDEVCIPTTGQCGPSAICPPSCDDGNPCTTDTCEVGQCVSVAVTDGDACQDEDECTTGASACSGGTCGTRECDTDIRQVIRSGVLQPIIQVDCLLVGLKPNGKAKTGTCSAKVGDATAASASIVRRAAARRKPKLAPLASAKAVRIKNGIGTLQLRLNARGRQLLGTSADGQLTVDVLATIRSRGTKARVSKLITLRR